MLLGSGVDMKSNKGDYTKSIKILLNKLISQSKKQFPRFKKKMKEIFISK